MILIVDDKPENIFSLRKLLELHGFRVDTADSGEEALKKILKGDYSLIILDVQMPGMDGFEVAETISGYSKSKDIPIIFLSAVNTDKRFVTKGYSSGGKDYITKPVDPDIFIHKVKALYQLSIDNRQLNLAHQNLSKEVEERKITELQLNERMQELRSILESLPQVAFTTKPGGELEYVNEHWYLYSDTVRKWPSVHPADQFEMDRLNNHFKSGESFSCELRIKHLLNGEYRCHILKVVPVKQGQEITKWVGSFTDIHEQKLANELLEKAVEERTYELRNKNEELESRNYELQQFAFVASHDLKEPLRKIQVFLSMLEKVMPEVKSGDAEKYINRVKHSAQRMNTLINDLLDYSRLSLESLFQPTDVGKVIKDIIDDLEYTIKSQQAKITVTNFPLIDAVPAQVRQVFQNLLINSLKFVKPGQPPEISISAELVESKEPGSKPSASGKYCRITVRDNGIGFNEDYLDKIFVMFQRLNPRDDYEGTGIGLAITRKIIERHHGLITAKSKVGEGATFIIVLPLKQPTNTWQPGQITNTHESTV